VSSFLLFFAYYAGETLIENGAILREGYTGTIIILTALIVCAGWLQFTILNHTSKGDFLLRIDTR
ncbi:hypothetical protein Lisr_1616, partial [Legionella israelensis]